MDNNEWTDDIEIFIMEIRNLCNERYKMHEEESDRCYKWYFWINIVLIFSGGLTTIFSLIYFIWETYDIQIFITVGTMILGIVTVISTSINKFCRFESRINDNIRVSIDYEKKKLEIDLELSKDYKNRKSENNYQLYINSLYTELVKYSPYVPEKYRNKYKLDNLMPKINYPHLLKSIRNDQLIVTVNKNYFEEEKKNENFLETTSSNEYNNWQIKKFLNQ